jgi:hypothetical protein
MMESLPLCKDAGEFGQRPGRTSDTANHVNYLQCPRSPSCLGMADDSEFLKMQADLQLAGLGERTQES